MDWPGLMLLLAWIFSTLAVVLVICSGQTSEETMDRTTEYPSTR